MIGRFKGFVNAFQFSNLGIDLGKINEAVFSPSDVAATVADAASGSNGWGTAAINLAAEASMPAKFYMPYVACLVAAAIAVVVAAELVCWCLAASCGCCVAKRARGIPGPSGGIALRSMTPSSTPSVAGAPKSGGSQEEPQVEAGGASRKQVHGAQSKRSSIRWLRFKVRRELTHCAVLPLCRLCCGLCWRELRNVDERAVCRYPELQVRSFLTHAWKLGASANALACFASLFLSANTLSAVLALCWIAVVCIVPAVVFGKHLFRAVGDDWRRPGHGKWSWSGTVRHACLLRRRMMWCGA